MAYLQITTKCNMTCAHCAFSCNKNGKHMTWETAVDSIRFAANWYDSITIGGGEPTLHPRFFDILRLCLEEFGSVFMVTNGSKTSTMYRLDDIIQGCDYENFDEYDEHDEHEDDIIFQEEKLSVALSQDYFHDTINQNVVDLWNAVQKPKRIITRLGTFPATKKI